MPRFRINETKEFPVDFSDGSIWYSIITSDLNYYDFTSSVSGKKEFINKISEFNKSGIKFLLLGIWHGMYRTDLFILEEKEIVSRISKVINK